MVGVILVGGESRRFGRNKALEILQGERLIDRQVRTMRALFAEVLVITNTPELYIHLDATIVRDVLPGQGPLGGIYTGLIFAHDESIFAVACDMPFVQPAVIKHMMHLAPGYDVVIPQKEAGLEPLHSIYSSRCLPHIKGMLDRQVLQVISFFPHVKVYCLSEKEIAKLDPLGVSFFNINTPQDLDRALELLDEM
jgi:molybdopterin-guanine dinucleotide biosynthesis protein A